MIIRAASVLVVVLGLSPGATAGGHTGILHRMSCTMVRYYVALYSATAAEQYARSKGATESGGKYSNCTGRWLHALARRADRVRPG
jgi:hypothetical protein